MRAVSTDRRLEAIAGKPRVNARGWWQGAVSAGSTLVAVGAYMPRAEEYADGQFLVNFNNFGFAYVKASGFGFAQGGKFGRFENGAYWGTVRADRDATAAIGTHHAGHVQSAKWNWQGPLRGVIYDRALTDAEALAVARSLSLSLSLSG